MQLRLLKQGTVNRVGKLPQGTKLTLLGSGGEPPYDGYQIWFNSDIPNYEDPAKNVINQKYSIKNYIF